LVFLVVLSIGIASTPSRTQERDETDALNKRVVELKRAGKYAEAVPLAERFVEAVKSRDGIDTPPYATALNNLASLYMDLGRHADAESLFKRSLAIDEKVRGVDDPKVGSRLNNLAVLYLAQGRTAEAEQLMKRALDLAEGKLIPDNKTLSTRLANLAGLYRNQGRYAEAEALYKRALKIDETAYDPEYPILGDLKILAQLFLAVGKSVIGRYADIDPLPTNEGALGPNHPAIGLHLNGLGLLYQDQGRYAEAEAQMKRALDIVEKALGPDHPDVATAVGNLAGLYFLQGRFAKAEPMMKRGLGIAEKAFGPDHPIVGNHLSHLAELYFAQSDWTRVASFWRRSTEITVRRAERDTGVAGEALTSKRKSEAELANWQFSGLVKAVHRLASQQRNSPGLQLEAFRAAQWAQSSEAAVSLAQMGVRGVKDDTKLAAIVRERQDLVLQWQGRDRLRIAAIAQAPYQRNEKAEAENVAELAAIDTRIAGIDKQLTANFPDYAALASPAPLSAEEVQARLGRDEALVLFLDTPASKPTPEETFIWVVTKTDMRWVRSDLGTPALIREVSALRCGLDYDMGSFLKGKRCAKALKAGYTVMDRARGKPLPFDLARSHALYKGLFGQIEDLISGKTLLIVPSGPLAQLPFHVLVTRPPKAALPSANTAYRDVAWLARSHAIMVMPAVSSLNALRGLAKETRASERYVGFGNPLLDGEPDKALDEKVRAERLANAQRARDRRCEAAEPPQTATLMDPQEGGARVTRGPEGLVDVASLRRWSPLPETADELCNVANILGVDPGAQAYIGARAQEKEIKRLSGDGQLAKYKIVHFATHGTLAGQLSPQAEPGLILTPPDKASDIDDGFLSASEIVALKLDADWVILSACNTAAGDATSAEALSGLARAFIYAGSRSLLASHWYVSSESAVPLITTAIAVLAVDPKLGRAEALRRSMLSMITDGKGYEAHPAFWAPFVLVGEGGAER
jgi:CHAT domain-containing protein/tetratricopeptide (TPR) repeat protein